MYSLAAISRPGSLRLVGSLSLSAACRGRGGRGPPEYRRVAGRGYASLMLPVTQAGPRVIRLGPCGTHCRGPGQAGTLPVPAASDSVTAGSARPGTRPPVSRSDQLPGDRRGSV